MNTLYTAGYQGHAPTDLARAAQQLDAVVCDIRIRANSRIPGWSGGELQSLLGERYVGLPEFGNVNANTGLPIQLSPDAPFGMVKLMNLLRRRDVILLCGCREYSQCHRRTVAELIHNVHRVEIRELPWPVSDTPPEHIKCISLWQPWASLIAWGAKHIETRSWATNYRGPLAIHAAKTADGFHDIIFEERDDAFGVREPFCRVLKLHGVEHLGDLPRGAVLAVVDLVDCVPTETLRENLTPCEAAFGDFSADRYGWILKNVRALPEPLLMRGAQGFFNVSLEPEALP